MKKLAHSKLIKYLAIGVIILLTFSLAYSFLFPYLQWGERSAKDEIDSWFTADYGLIISPYYQGSLAVWNAIRNTFPGLSDALSVLLNSTGFEDVIPQSTTQYVRLTIVLSCEHRVTQDGYTLHTEDRSHVLKTEYKDYYTYYEHIILNPLQEDILVAWNIVDTIPDGSVELMDSVYAYGRENVIHPDPTKDNWFEWCPVEFTVKIQNATNPDISFLVFKDRFPVEEGTHQYFYYIMFDNSTFEPDLYQVYLRADGWKHFTSWQRVDWYAHRSFRGWSYYPSYMNYANYKVEVDVGTIYERVMVMA